jgi:hypothetical protein
MREVTGCAINLTKDGYIESFAIFIVAADYVIRFK